jgi:hypothetical protein
MLGLRIRGRTVIGQCRSEGWRARVEAFLGREVGEQGARTSGVLLSWFWAEFTQCPPGQTTRQFSTTVGRGSYTCSAMFSSSMEWGTLRRGCGSTASLTGTRRVTPARAL